MKDFGFIILRCVLHPDQDIFWLNCYNTIRKYYTDISIVIIDDNSTKEFLKNDNKIDSNNTTIIFSTFLKGRGEILPYYYLYNDKLFKKTVIIHDSTFINKYIDFSLYSNKFLYYFDKHKYDQIDLEMKMLEQLDNNNLLIESHNNKNIWNGCFGCMTIINIDFMIHIQEKYNILKLMDFIDNRHKRMCLERVLGIIFFVERKETKKNCSLFGDIYKFPKAFHLDLNKYLQSQLVYKKYALVKFWNRR
jgi:hypothetical protein